MNAVSSTAELVTGAMPVADLDDIPRSREWWRREAEAAGTDWISLAEAMAAVLAKWEASFRFDGEAVQ